MNKITKRDQWVVVSMDGFGQLMASRPKVAVLYDLIQNAIDEDVKTVDVKLESISGRRGRARLTVEDDSPEGFADLTDAYTMYKPSKKKGDPTKRGRFNEGEKFVLSQCDSATITTTTGTVMFDDDGRTTSRATRPCGSVFDGIVRWTQDDVEEVLKAVQHLLVPEGVTVTINGSVMVGREPIKRIMGISLPTIRVSESGVFRPTSRSTCVDVVRVDPTNGEKPHIYEMGIPVVEIDTPWHINVDQKVPLNRDRDNVTPAYRRTLLGAVLEETHGLLDEEETSAVWVTDAIPGANEDTVKSVMDTRHGEGWVIGTPSDREADKNAIAHGYQVVNGGSYTRDVWTAVRETEAAVSSATDFSLKPKGNISDPKLATGWKAEQIQEYCKKAVRHLLDKDMKIEVYDDGRLVAGLHNPSRILINLAHMQRSTTEWLNLQLDDLLIHECAHEFSGDHLTMGYIHACTRLGAKFRTFDLKLKLEEPA